VPGATNDRETNIALYDTSIGDAKSLRPLALHPDRSEKNARHPRQLATVSIMTSVISAIVPRLAACSIVTVVRKIPISSSISQSPLGIASNDGPDSPFAEVLSPDDVPGEVIARAGEWLAAGTRIVWLIDPRRSEVHVYRLDGSVSILREDDQLDGEDVLPGFVCAVKEIFA
jgi:hypothetical protein